MSDRKDAEWVRESVIKSVESGETNLARSGAWLAERDELGNIQVYRHQEEIEA